MQGKSERKMRFYVQKCYSFAFKVSSISAKRVDLTLSFDRAFLVFGSNFLASLGLPICIKYSIAPKVNINICESYFELSNFEYKCKGKWCNNYQIMGWTCAFFAELTKWVTADVISPIVTFRDERGCMPIVILFFLFLCDKDGIFFLQSLIMLGLSFFCMLQVYSGGEFSLKKMCHECH